MSKIPAEISVSDRALETGSASTGMKPTVQAIHESRWRELPPEDRLRPRATDPSTMFVYTRGAPGVGKTSLIYSVCWPHRSRSPLTHK